MNKMQALHSFWSGFGFLAYEENAVPSGKDAPAFPHITYTAVFDSLGNEVGLIGNVWTRSTSWEQAFLIQDEIEKALQNGGKIINFDGGKLWLKRGSPFAQPMGDDSDDLIRRIYINISAEFFAE